MSGVFQNIDPSPHHPASVLNTEIRHTLDPSFLSFPAISAGAYTTTLVVMEAVVS
jgi:hypothetical protein